MRFHCTTLHSCTRVGQLVGCRKDTGKSIRDNWEGQLCLLDKACTALLWGAFAKRFLLANHHGCICENEWLTY